METLQRFVVQPPALVRFAPYAAIAVVVAIVIAVIPKPRVAPPAEVTCTRESNRCVIGELEYRADELVKIETRDETGEECPARSLTLTFQSGALKQLQYVGKSCARDAVTAGENELNRFATHAIEQTHVSFPRVQPAARRGYLLPLGAFALIAAIAVYIFRRSASVTIDPEKGDLLMVVRARGATLSKHLLLAEVRGARVLDERVEVLYGDEWEPLEMELTRARAEELAAMINSVRAASTTAPLPR